MAVTPIALANGSRETATLGRPPAISADDIEIVPDGAALRVQRLTISYATPGGVHAPIDDLSFIAPAGRVTALIGRSGSGKTSLLTCIAGLLRASSGQVHLGDVEVSALRGKALDDYRRSTVGVVHQSYNLIPSLTAIENVAVPMVLVGRSRKAANARATELLESLGLSSQLRRRPNQMSGGQQQRVAMARALANQPKLVLADEPTAHLDGSSVDDVCALLGSMSDAGHTVVVATHDDRLLDAVGHRVQLVSR